MHQQGPEHQEMQMDTVSMHGTEHRDEPLPETAAPRGKEGAEVHHGGCTPCSFASPALRKALQGEKGQDMVAGCPHQCCKQPQPQDTHNVDKGSSKATEGIPQTLDEAFSQMGTAAGAQHRSSLLPRASPPLQEHISQRSSPGWAQPPTSTHCPLAPRCLLPIP